MDGDLKAGVVGAGVFGGYHANKYASLPGVRLMGVLDADAARAGALADKLGVTAYTDIDTFLAQVDAVTVASPASTHAEIARQALDWDRPVYVEKPLALKAADGRALVALARDKGLVLAAGHQERAIFGAMGLLDAPETPVRLEAVRRSSYYPGRGTDVSCVLDMMIHDLDLALALNPTAPAELKAKGRIEHGPHLDEVFTEMTFADGMELTVDCSRLDEGRVRTMRIVYPSGVVELDFMAKTFRNTTAFPLNADYAETAGGKDPLGASVGAFLDAVRGRAPRPLVTGEEALEALDLALRVEAAALGAR
jgi:predicted dehydrogenase